MSEKMGMKDSFSADITKGGIMDARLRIAGKYIVECYGKDGELKWKDEIINTVVDEGCNDILDKYWKGSSYSAAHYLGLKGTGTVSASDTMSSHSGWSELVGYTESARPTITFGTVSGKSVDNSASKASYSINATATVAGAFATTDSTKSGTSGTLVSAGDFSSSKSVSSGDTLTVQYTSSLASS
jgi:hypothetical protein